MDNTTNVVINSIDVVIANLNGTEYLYLQANLTIWSSSGEYEQYEDNVGLSVERINQLGYMGVHDEVVAHVLENGECSSMRDENALNVTIDKELIDAIPHVIRRYFTVKAVIEAA